jgi:hypothetical protein
MTDYDQESGELIEARPQVPAVPQQAIVPLASPNCAQVWGALAIAQGKFEAPKRTKEGKIQGTTKTGRDYNYSYKYAPLEEVERVIKAPLAENSLFRQQYLVSRGGQWFIRTLIGHASGEWIACDYPVFVDRAGSQGFASGVTYARRYGLSLILGLSPEDDDDAAAADALTGADTRPPTDDTPRRETATQRPPQAPATDPTDPVRKASEAWKWLQRTIDGADTMQALWVLDPKLTEPVRHSAWDDLQAGAKQHWPTMVRRWEMKHASLKQLADLSGEVA